MEKERDQKKTTSKSKNNDVQISKKLSSILRHRAVEEGLKVMADGSVLLDDLLKLKQFNGVTQSQIERIVKDNDKQRFSLLEKSNESKNNHPIYYIRANQGHSVDVGSKINVNELLVELKDPLPNCVHGTTFKAWAEIKTKGLNKMQRTHIHFANDTDLERVVSGFRSDSAVLIHVDMAKAMKDNIKFYMSENKVILTEGVNGVLDPKYFNKIEIKNQKVKK